MNRDPLYRKIVERLAERLDGNLFQACAAALLGKVHKNLAPMPGGDDAGMDGAFGTANGAFPLVCTTQPDVIGNFRKSISQYLAKCSGPKRAVVATSQKLSNARKRNLKKAAEVLGVVLENIYEASYFADQLYCNSQWRLELLGITGESPALSVLPRNGRFAQVEILVGRDDDVAWLKKVQGDALLVGQPGSGKTYLHQYLANDDFCLFAVDQSLTKLANAIRQLSPSIIVIDDAHVNLTLVETLKWLRVELGREFRIHLNCWPHAESVIQRALCIPETNVRRLRSLRKSEIFELIKRLGVTRPDWLQDLIISQADGKPGLAVALCELCKIEGVSRIWTGDATAQQLLGDLRIVPNEKERSILAAFAVGGDVGMSFNHVSQSLNLSEIELRQITAGLGAGGVVQEVAQGRLQVRPPAIRPILVRDVFYGGANSLSIRPLLERTSSPESTASVLLSARQRGAKIDQQLLIDLVASAQSVGIWEHFAWVSKECAEYVFEKSPQYIPYAILGLLHHLPNRALHAYLDADEAELKRVGNGFRQQISEWLFPFEEPPAKLIERRTLLLEVLEERVRQSKVGSGQSFSWALSEILEAKFDVARTSPGSRRVVNCKRGVASHLVLKEITKLWPRIRALLSHVPPTGIRILFEQIENWCLPQRLSLLSPLTKRTHRLVRSHGQLMLSDVLNLTGCNRAWRTWAATVATWGKIRKEISVDPTYDAIYSDRDYFQPWEEQWRKRSEEFARVSEELLSLPIDAAIQYLEELRSEAVEFGQRNSNGYLWNIYQQIANRCDRPIAWIDELINKRCQSEFFTPFLYRLPEDGPDLDAVLRKLFQYADYQALAVNRILRLSSYSEELFSKSNDYLNNPKVMESIHLGSAEISHETIAKLLGHSDPTVRAAAAIGEWHRGASDDLPPRMDGLWKVAVRDIKSHEYVLTEIFQRDSSLAYEWLHYQMRSSAVAFSEDDQGFLTACGVISKDQRSQLLRLFTRENYSDEVFDQIIANHVDLYSDWLNYQFGSKLRWRPLARDIGPRWEQMALIALDAGLSPEELAEYCVPSYLDGWGNLSKKYLERIPAYEALSVSHDPRLRPAGKHGLKIMKERAQSEQEWERSREIDDD